MPVIFDAIELLIILSFPATKGSLILVFEGTSRKSSAQQKLKAASRVLAKMKRFAGVPHKT